MTSERGERAQETLVSFVSPAYQDPMRLWLDEHIGLTELSEAVLHPEAEPERSVSFPITHPETQHESWVCLTLLGLASSHDGSRGFMLTEVSSRRHQEQLAARAAGLIGLRHDLANQLFLFKALPELTAFSSPEELIGDVTESASGLLEFIEARLGSSWISAHQPTAVSGAEAIIETLGSWVERSALDRARWRLSIDESLLETEPPTLTCLGVQWSLSQLATLLKRSLISGVDARAQILVKLMRYTSSLHASEPNAARARVGLCGQLARRDPRYALAVSVEGWDPSEAISAWRLGRGWTSGWSGLRSAHEDPDDALAAWFGSWVSAAHQTQGIVELDEISLGGAPHEPRRSPALLICI